LPSNLDSIAREWGPRLGLSRENIKSYLTENIHYFLDPPCLDGMQLFYQYAQECGALSSVPPLFFLDSAKAATI
jgi:chorismate dehydratase